MKRLITLTALLVLSINIFAQDLIVRKNPKAEIECNIVEIGEDLVYYTAYLGGEERKFSIDKNNIIYIKFENGEVLNMENSMFGKNQYQDNTNNAIKINFLSPLYGITAFEYERSISPGQSWTAGFGIYGLGVEFIDANPIGFTLNGGFRFYRSPDYYVRNMKYAHLLKGSYVMPRFSVSLINTKVETYFYDYTYGFTIPDSKRVNIASMNIMVFFGKQWVFSNRFLIDFSYGLGYSFSNFDEEDYYGYNTYAVGYMYNSGTRFTNTLSLKLGYLFHDKKQKKDIIPQL